MAHRRPRLEHDEPNTPPTQEAAADWYEALVTRIPGVQGGIPVLIGTRTPVSSVVAYHETYRGDRGEVQDALAHLTPQQIDAALAYYERHRDEIDADTRRDTELRERMQRAG